MGYRPYNWEKIKVGLFSDAILNQDDFLDRLIEAGADAMLEALIAQGRYYRLHRTFTPPGYKQSVRAPGWVVFIPEKTERKERE